MTTTMLDPKLLGFWARCVREAQHLSQEAIAEAAGITVRTVQRFEAGEGVQIGSRRSLAKALGYGDQDIFDDPKFAATVLGFFDDLKAFQQKQVDNQHPDNQMRLPAQLISCGEEAIQFAQGNDAVTVDISPELNRGSLILASEPLWLIRSSSLRDQGDRRCVRPRFTLVGEHLGAPGAAVCGSSVTTNICKASRIRSATVLPPPP
jgi:transcriptional regulator with XRE-family HTH domain